MIPLIKHFLSTYFLDEEELWSVCRQLRLDPAFLEHLDHDDTINMISNLSNIFLVRSSVSSILKYVAG